MPITAQPGARFQYCSRCVVLAAYALEQIDGQSWEAYTRGHIFEPLGMVTASFGPSGWSRRPTELNRIAMTLYRAKCRYLGAVSSTCRRWALRAASTQTLTKWRATRFCN
jgi:CubicO group peptidase (beta-lactamase class C family)